MSRADEMFEKLGYKVRYLINHDEITLIGYTKNKDIKAEECEIMFLKKAHVFTVNVWLSIQELQAINEKCRELRMDGEIV